MGMSVLKFVYAAFFSPALTLVHLARCAAAILRRAAIAMIRLGAVPDVFNAGCGPFLVLPHRAF